MCEQKDQEMKTTRSIASSEDGMNPDIMNLGDAENLTSQMKLTNDENAAMKAEEINY